MNITVVISPCISKHSTNIRIHVKQASDSTFLVQFAGKVWLTHGLQLQSRQNTCTHGKTKQAWCILVVFKCTKRYDRVIIQRKSGDLDITEIRAENCQASEWRIPNLCTQYNEKLCASSTAAD